MTDLFKVLRPLSDETRFKILNLLLSHDLCVRALAHRLEISESAVSQHLQILRRAGWVRGEKRGYWTHYSVDRKLLNEVGDALIRMASGALGDETGDHGNVSIESAPSGQARKQNV
jgi:DNA-binding transcriptional ArsR family regulator